MLGGRGNDELLGYAGDDQLAGGSGDDSLDGGRGNDILAGALGIDTLFGAAGNDVLAGNEGGDILTGGRGADRFVFSAISDSTTSNPDRITDFDPKRDLLVFKDLLQGQFVFVGNTDFTDSGNSQARFDGSNRMLEIDVDGSGSADMAVVLLGLSSSKMDSNLFLWS